MFFILHSVFPFFLKQKQIPFFQNNKGDLIEFSKEIRGEYGVSIPAMGLCGLLALLIGIFIFSNSHLLNRMFEFSDRGSIMMFVAVTAEVLLGYHLYRLSTVEMSISENVLKFSQTDDVTTVKLKEIESVRKRGAVIILVTKNGEKKVPHFGIFGEFGLIREFDALGLLNKGPAQ